MEYIQGRMDVAVEHGADVAIFVHCIAHWVEWNAARGVNYHDGRFWTFNSLNNWSKVYPLWSRDQVKRLIAKCKDLGLILVGNYNKNEKDRTQWFTLSDEMLVRYEMGHLCPKTCGENATSCGENATSCGENATACGENATTIPSIYQDNTQDTPCSPPEGDGAQPAEKSKGKRGRKAKAVPEWRPEKFEGFWQAYPRDEDRAKAVEQWDALPKDKELMARHGGDEDRLLTEIAQGLKRHLACDDWRNRIGVPYAFRWLRDRRWTEKAKTGAPELQAPLPPRKYTTQIVDGEEMVSPD